MHLKAMPSTNDIALPIFPWSLKLIKIPTIVENSAIAFIEEPTISPDRIRIARKATKDVVAPGVKPYRRIDKTIGMAIGKDINFGRVFLLVSGRISEGMVAKCVRCRIPLLVSKAAILDSAIGKCIETGLSAVSFTTGIAVVGKALTFSPKPKSGKSNSK